MLIRQARKEDAKEVAKLRKLTIRKVNREDYSKSEIKTWSKYVTYRMFEKAITDPKVLFYVAVEKNMIVGFGDFGLNSKLRGLFVHPKWIGKGVGNKIVRRIEKDAKKQGLKNLKLEATITAYGFYRKMGYTKVRKIRSKVGDAKLIVYKMRKTL